MSKYYTRACNFYYGKSSLEMLKKKKALSLHGNKKLSFDTRDFDISFSRGLSLEDWEATLTEFTGYLISEGLKFISQKNNITFLLCGGGRKNISLIHCIKNYLTNENNITLEVIDNYNLKGDYIESQAFGFLAIRSFLNLPISFPNTTGCKGFTVGGKLVENY